MDANFDFMSYEQNFLLALLLTLIVEVPIVFILINYFYKYKKETSDTIFVGILASTLTLPYLWFVLPSFILNRGIYEVLGEILVILTEALIYCKLLKLKPVDALFVSLIANIASIALGLLIHL